MRGKKYIEDIQYLKKLKVLNKVAYQDFLKKVCNTHTVSNKTVYRDMKKKIPGARKIRKDRGKDKTPVTKKEKLIITELLNTGMTKKEAKEVTEKTLHKKISTRKLTKIQPNSEIEESNFGKDIKKFLEKYFNFDVIAPETGIKIKLKDKNFIINKEDVSDVILILTNAFNRTASDNEKLKFDKLQLFETKQFHLIEEYQRIAEQRIDIKMLEATNRMFLSLKRTNKIQSADFDVVMKICQHLKPDITTNDIITLIEKYSEE